MEALNLSESFLDELNLSSEGTTVHKGELKTFAGCQRRFSLTAAVVMLWLGIRGKDTGMSFVPPGAKAGPLWASWKKK